MQKKYQYLQLSYAILELDTCGKTYINPKKITHQDLVQCGLHGKVQNCDG